MNSSSNVAVREYTWTEMDNICGSLSVAITASSFCPDVIIGIARGGCFPSLLLSHRFQVRELYTINVATTLDDSIRASRNAPVVRTVSALPPLSSKNVLLVDDVTNSGATLIAAKLAIEGLHPGMLRVACPIWDTVSESGAELDTCVADYFVDKIHSWAKFPWEQP